MKRVLAIALIASVSPVILAAQWLNYKIPGVPRTADGKVNLTAPAPRTAGGKPDLSGAWESDYGYFGNLARDLKADEVVMHPWAEALVKQHESVLHGDDLLVQCLPEGVPRINMSASRGMPHPFKIV